MLLYIQITGKVIQKILNLFNLQRSVFTMLKKIVSGMLAAGMMLASVSAFACDCGSEYKKTYEYPYIGNDKHQVAYRCSNPNCDDPFTLVGTYDCTYEWVEYENPDTWSISWVQMCTVCGHIKD